MKYVIALCIILTSMTAFARRGNPRSNAAATIDLQYYIVDSDDNLPKKPNYQFRDTTGSGWFRVPALSDKDSGYVRLYPQGTTLNFVHYNKNITLPPRYIHANGFVSYDSVTPGTLQDTFFRRMNSMTSQDLPVFVFGAAFPLWCDLELRTTGDSSKIFYRATTDTCWVNFYNMFLKGTNGKIRATFQIVYVRTDSSITFQYKSFDGAIDGESAASIFQKVVTIGVQDSTGDFSTTYLDHGVYNARSFSGSAYEKDLHNGLAVKFIRAIPNLIRIVAIDDPPSNNYELTGTTFAPIIRVENLASTPQTIYITNTVINTTSGVTFYSRTDSIVNAPSGITSYTGTSQSGFPCGAFRLVSSISLNADAWTHDNTMTRDFVKVSPLTFPIIDDFIKLDRCAWQVNGATFVPAEEDVERDAAAPRNTGTVVLNRADAAGNPYRTNISGDTLITAPIDMTGKSNVWMIFSYQRGLKADSIQAGIRKRILIGPEQQDSLSGSVISGDSLLIEGIPSTSATYNIPGANWVTLATIYGGIDVETKKFRLQLPLAYIHNHSRFRIRLAAKNDGPLYGAPFDDLDNFVIDNLQIVSPVAGKKLETDLEVTGVDLGAKQWTHIPRDAHSLLPKVKIASNGLQATQAVYQVRLVINDALSREVYHRLQSIVAPAPRTDVVLTMPEWVIEGAQGGVFTCKATIEQMFSDYHTANDTNVIYRKLMIDDAYAYDDAIPDTAGTMTEAENSWFYHTFTPIKSDSLRGFDLYHLAPTGTTNWTFTFRDAGGAVLFTRNATYNADQRGFFRAAITPTYLQNNKVYEIQCNMTQGSGLGGDASRSLVTKRSMTQNLSPVYTSLYDSLLALWKTKNGAVYSGEQLNGTGGGPLLPMMRLVFAGSATYLPVELVSFTAKRTTLGDVVLNFQSAKEENLSGYEIEHLANNTWIHTADVIGKNSRTGAEYNVIDALAPKTQTTYRLTELDLDGSRHELGSASVEALNGYDIGIAIHPNPASDIFTLQLGIHSVPSVISVFNELGIEVLRKENVTSDELQIDASHLSAGVYSVEVAQGEFVQRVKLVVAR